MIKSQTVTTPKGIEDKQQYKHSFLKDVSKVFSSNVLVLVLSFLSSIMIARNLGTSGKGLLTIILIYPNMIIALSQMGIRQVTVLEIGRKIFPFDRIIGNVITLYFIISTISVIICFYLLRINPSAFSLPMVLLAITTIPLTLIKSYSGGIFLGKQKVGLSATVTWLPAFLRVGCLYLFLFVFKFGIIGALLSTVVAGLPVAIFAIFRLHQEVSLIPKWDSQIQKNMIGLGTVYALALFINTLNYKMDVILLDRLSGAAEVGLYSVGVQFAELVLQVSSAFGLVIFSRSSNTKDPRRFSQETLKLLKVGLLIAIAFGTLLCITAPYVIPIVYKEQFRRSVPMMQLLIPGIIALVGYKLIGFDMAGKGKPWFSIIASLPGLVVNFFLNLLLIPTYGGCGAAVASSISYIIMGLAHFVIFKYYLRNLK